MAKNITVIVVVVVWIMPLALWFAWYLDLMDVLSFNHIHRVGTRGGTIRASGILRSSNYTIATSKRTGDKPPLLIIHVGPQKTNASAIQRFVASHMETLQNDNFYFLGHFPDRPELSLDEFSRFCTRQFESNCTNAWQKLEEKLNHHRALSHNVFVSHDWFGAFRDEVEAQEFLWKPLIPILHRWRVRVVYSYRRLHEWLPHNYHQLNSTSKTLNQWPGRGGREIPSFPEVFTLVSHKKSKHPRALVKRWQHKLVNNRELDAELRVFNVHEPGEMLANFYCQMIPEASQLCDLLSSLYSNETRNVPDYDNDLHFDMLAVEAYKRGWIKNDLSRAAVVSAAKTHAKALQYRIRKDYPLTCLSDDQTNKLLNLSLTMERDMLPDFYASNDGEDMLKFTFRKAKQAKLFCSVNVNEMLQDTRWEDFFKSLTIPTIKEEEQQFSKWTKSSTTTGDVMPIDYPNLDVDINFLGIGAQGSGTSWLAQMLRVCCSTRISFGVKKELHFWDWNRHNGLGWYSEQFPDRHNMTEALHGEITPHYMSLPEEDVAEIRLLFPSVKIFFLARDMVDRTWSHVRKGLRHQSRKGNLESFDPADFSDDYFLSKAGDASHEERSNYDVALRRWYKHFPEDQILLLNFDDILENPVGLLNQVLEHIGINASDDSINMTAVTEASNEPVNTGAYGGELRPSLRGKLQDMYRPHALAFNKLLKEQGYTWELDTYEHSLHDAGSPSD